MGGIPAQRFVSRSWIGLGLRICVAAVLTLAAVIPLAAESSYGFIRTVDGDADLLSGGTLPAIEATANYPIQVGDQVLISAGGRLEVVLPDRSRLRLDSNTDLKFGRLAQSVDTHDDQTLLVLGQGQIQMAVVSDPIDPRALRIDTANSSLFLLSRGSYRVFTDGKTWTQVIVREGFAEVATEAGTDRVATGQQALIDGERSPEVTLQAAPALDGLEQWAHRLEEEANTVQAQVPYRRGYISPNLGYAATRLNHHGRWMEYRGSRVWRPHVSPGWRPYHSGWWIYTPYGLTWVSTEPWGWVPYHYGYWGQAGGTGWVWYPGHRYTPGAVYWYWGPTHIGWVPAGYYSLHPYGYFGGIHVPTPHYNQWPRHGSVGIHARADGRISHWRDWTFSSYEKFGYRDNYRSLHTGADLERHGVFQDQIPRGVMTTDTRALTPNLWNEPPRVLATLESSRPGRSRPTKLSPLGAAALSGLTDRPLAPENRSSLRGSQPRQDARQWGSEVRRRDQLTRPQAVSPYRRDSRSSASSLRSYGSRTPARRSWTRGQSATGRPGFSRPAQPGVGRTTIGGSRSTTAAPRSGIDRGRISTPGRSSAGRSGRMSGAARSGRPVGGGARGSTSGDGGSG